MSKVITEISVPVLNDSNFGNNLKEQFENINNNFKILASAEFMKGAEGKAIKLSEVPAFEKNIEGDYIFTSLGAKLFSAILDITINENDSLNEIKNLIEIEEDSYKQWAKLSTSAKYSVFDSFKTSDDEYNGTINLYSYEDEENYIYSPMNYFRDARIDELNDSESDVSNFSDASCSYIYDGEKFKTYTLYPTLYYNSTLGLICWKVNGEETSIAAQGLKGKDGNTCSVHILKCEVENTANDLISIKATQYFYPGKDESESAWHDIDDVVSIINNNEDTKYKKISDIFGKTDLYFCIIDDIYDYTFANYPSIDDDGTVKFIVDNSALIGCKAFINNFRDMVNNFNHNAGDGYPNAASLKGFYLPFTNDKKLVHSIYVSSEKIVSTDNDNNEKIIEKSVLNIDVESKDIYTNNNIDKYEEEIEKSSINIKNHDVNIQEGNLTVGGNIETSGNIKTTGLQVTVDGTVHASFDDADAVILTDTINFTTGEMRINGVDNSSTNSVMEVNNFKEINIGNTNDGEEPDKCLTIRKDTEVNIGGNVKIDSNVNVTGMLQSEFMLPVGSVIMFSMPKEDIPFNWKICNGKTYYVNKQTGDIQEKSNSRRLERPDTPLIPPLGYEEITTPDLRGRFVVGVNNDDIGRNLDLASYDRGNTTVYNSETGSRESGKEFVKLTGQQSGIQAHSHNLYGYPTYGTSDEGNDYIIDKNSDTKNNPGYKFANEYTYTKGHNSALEAHINLPPFYALYYIMKLL